MFRDPFCQGEEPPDLIYGSYRFITADQDELKPYKEAWHEDERFSRFDTRKTLPSNIKDLLKDPVSLAVWFLDDSTWSSNHFSKAVPLPLSH